MRSKGLKFFIYGFSIIFIQVIFVNNINIFGFIFPKIFPIFLLLMPRTINHIIYMFIAALIGFFVDIFSFTYGISMASLIFIAFINPYILNFLYNKSIDEEPIISIENQGSNFVGRYLFLNLLIFHFVYFLIEHGSLNNIFYIILSTILSSLSALILYFIFVFMFLNHKDKKDIRL